MNKFCKNGIIVVTVGKLSAAYIIRLGVSIMNKKTNILRNAKSAAALSLCLLISAGLMTSCGSNDSSSKSEKKKTTTTTVTTAQTEKATETTTTTAEEIKGPEDETSETTEIDADEMLSLWADGAKAKDELVSYMGAITVEGSDAYIPPEDRIAVFDLDGTLFCETDPNYFDYTLLKYRVLEDKDYIDKASDFEKETAEKIAKQNETGESFEGLEVDHGKAVASAFKGMTLDEFNDYIQEFKQQDMPSYEGMKRGEGFYLPMLQIVEYLEANDFTVYIVSGTDRVIVRGIVDNSPLDVPARQIIGSDETLIAPDQGDEDGLEYVYDDDDKVVLGGEFIIKNLKMNKVTVIAQEIGQQPVLSFGNSSGDASMCEYVTSHNDYKSMAFMLCCDDTERENGNIEKAEKMEKLCEEHSWVPISMKNDWTTIYGDDVKYIKK